MNKNQPKGDIKMRMRTIQQLADHYKKEDPETAVTAHFIRATVIDGRVPCSPAGSKRLIAIEHFDAFLAGEEATVETVPQLGVVRPVK
jgi:hypothetical protein